MSSLVSRITSDDENPLSGYQLKELAEAAASSLKESEAIRQALLNRLQKKSPNVKSKVLRALKHLCLNGPPDFRIAMQRSTTEVKECVTFKCPPCPLRGDKPASNVREAATECLSAIFNATPTSTSKSSEVSSRIQGFGTAVPESTSITGFHIRDKLRNVILGDTKPNNTNTSSLDSTSIGVFGGAVQSKYQGFGHNNFGAQAHAAGYAHYTQKPLASASESTAVSKNTGLNRSSLHSQGFSRSSRAQNEAHDMPIARLAQSPLTTPSVPQHAVPPLQLLNDATPGPFELKLVSDATAPSGIRVLLTSEEKQRFVSACAQLTQAAIASALLSAAHTGPVARTIKALSLIEALLETEQASQGTPARVFFHEDTEALAVFTQHSNKHVHAFATRILALLGLALPLHPGSPAEQGVALPPTSIGTCASLPDESSKLASPVNDPFAALADILGSSTEISVSNARPTTSAQHVDVTPMPTTIVHDTPYEDIFNVLPTASITTSHDNVTVMSHGRAEPLADSGDAFASLLSENNDDISAFAFLNSSTTQEAEDIYANINSQNTSSQSSTTQVLGAPDAHKPSASTGSAFDFVDAFL